MTVLSVGEDGEHLELLYVTDRNVGWCNFEIV